MLYRSDFWPGSARSCVSSNMTMPVLRRAVSTIRAASRLPTSALRSSADITRRWVSLRSTPSRRSAFPISAPSPRIRKSLFYSLPARHFRHQGKILRSRRRLLAGQPVVDGLDRVILNVDPSAARARSLVLTGNLSFVWNQFHCVSCSATDARLVQRPRQPQCNFRKHQQQSETDQL